MPWMIVTLKRKKGDGRGSKSLFNILQLEGRGQASKANGLPPSHLSSWLRFALTAPSEPAHPSPTPLQVCLDAFGLRASPWALRTALCLVPQACCLGGTPQEPAAGPGETEDVQQGPSSWLHKESLRTT